MMYYRMDLDFLSYSPWKEVPDLIHMTHSCSLSRTMRSVIYVGSKAATVLYEWDT